MLVGLLAEEDRLRAFAAVVLGATTVDDVAGVTGLEPAAASRALERLAAGGLVLTGDGGGLAAARDLFKSSARSAAEARAAADPPDEFGDVAEADAAVLRTFVRGGRLARIPAQLAKRRILLDWLSSRFEPGRTYPEPLVNEMLAEVHDDVAALRRYLVDEEFLDRRDGFYWRSGGTFTV
jgi:hypothetical protein